MNPNENNIDSGAKFEGNSWRALKYYRETVPPKIIKLIIKYSGGLIKSEKLAGYVVLGLVVLIFAISFYLFFGGNIGKSSGVGDRAILEQTQSPDSELVP